MSRSISSIIFGLGKRGLLRWIPDKTYLKLIYWAQFKKKLNIDNPKSFNEKLQWLKLYDRNPNYITMVDKLEVKKYVSKIIGDEYVIPTIGEYDSFDDIDFNALPNQFVLKCTHDSGGLVVCRDKHKLDIREAKNKINRSLKNNYFNLGREWPYKNVKPKIIAEKYMEDASSNELIDYKWFCCNGKVKFLYVSHGLENHATARISFYDLQYNEVSFRRVDYEPFDSKPPKPKNFDDMIKIAEKLSANIPFVRIDLYEINEKIYFSEITFSPCTGLIPFEPIEWDMKLGELLTINNIPEN